MVNTEEQRRDWKIAWSNGLAGLAVEKIAAAATLCAQRHDWPPSPAEFRKLVESPIDYERMFINAANALSTRRWPDKVMYWSACAFGHYDLVRMSYPAAKTRWQSVVDEIAAEDVLPEIPDHEIKQLPEPGQTMNREVAFAELEKAKRILRGDAA